MGERCVVSYYSVWEDICGFVRYCVLGYSCGFTGY